jgi:aldehyde dehydrogenase (NAD+)
MKALLDSLGVRPVNSGASSGTTDGWRDVSGTELTSFSPIDGSPLAAVRQAEIADYEAVMSKAQETFRRWRLMPAPQRGEIVREMGNALRTNKEALGALVTLEAGKVKAEVRARSRR